MNGGFNARTVELYQETKTLYAVRIGNYNTAKEAKEVGNKIKSILKLDKIVALLPK